MPKLRNTNETFWMIFKQGGVANFIVHAMKKMSRVVFWFLLPDDNM